MRKTPIILVSLLVLGAGAVVVAPRLVPVDKVKAVLNDRIRAATGRDLVIAGAVDASIFSGVSLRVGGVALSNPAGFRSKDLVRVEELRVALKPFALLSGRVEVDGLTLVNPVIALETTADGRADWIFSSPTEGKPSAGTTTPPPAPSGGGKAAPMIADLGLADARVINGKLTWFDARSGTEATIDAVNLNAALPSLDAPLQAKGTLVWRGETVDVALDAAKPRALVEGGGQTAIALTVRAKPVQLTLDGTLDAGSSTFSGRVDLSSPSARTAAAWTGGKPITAPGTTMGPLSFKAETTASAKRVAFKKLALELDAIKLAGEASLDLAGTVPVVGAKLETDKLDVDPYLAAGNEAAPSPAKTDGAPAPTASAPAGQGGGWSEAPIDVSVLKSVDVDVSLTAGAARARGIDFGRTRLAVAARGGKMTVDLAETTLFKGAASGKLAVDGSRSGIAGVDVQAALKGVAVEPLAKTFGGFDRLEGTGDMNVHLSGRGANQKQIVSSLAGDGRIVLTDGAIKGINLAAMVRDPTGALGGDQSRKTDFAELSGSFTVSNGILVNKDLALMAPLVRLAGAGAVDLPKRQVKYVLTPKAAATLEGQGGKRDVTGVLVPVIVEGPWDNPSFRPDLEAMIKGNAEGKAQKLLEGVGGDLGKGIDDAVKGLGDVKLPKLDPGALFR